MKVETHIDWRLSEHTAAPLLVEGACDERTFRNVRIVTLERPYYRRCGSITAVEEFLLGS